MTYNTDLADEQWKIVASLIPVTVGAGRPR